MGRIAGLARHGPRITCACSKCDFLKTDRNGEPCDGVVGAAVRGERDEGFLSTRTKILCRTTTSFCFPPLIAALIASTSVVYAEPAGKVRLAAYHLSADLQGAAALVRSLDYFVDAVIGLTGIPGGPPSRRRGARAQAGVNYTISQQFGTRPTSSAASPRRTSRPPRRPL